MTVLLAIHHKSGTIELDYGSNEYLNQKLLSLSEVTFSTVFNGIQVAFTVDKVIKGHCKWGECFVIKIPKSLYWFNRRDFYRVNTPIINGAYIEISLLPPEDGSEFDEKEAYRVAIERIHLKLIEDIKNDIINEYVAWERAFKKMNITSRKKATVQREIFEDERDSIAIVTSPKLANIVRLPLLDISMRGCRLINIDPEFSHFLQTHTLFKNCTLMTPKFVADVSFRIVSVNLGETFKPTDFEEYIGIVFENIEQIVKGAILHYVQDIERQSGVLNNV
jgi:c-di-GMP-binding flagellar brake protein YcgR